MERKAAPPRAKCQEASPQSRGSYIPCGAPAVFVVKNRDPDPYFMCEMCADHNVRNRGARYVMADETESAFRPEVGESDVEPMEPPADAELASVAGLAREQLAAEDEVRAAESTLKAANARLAAVRDGALPAAFAALGLAEFKLEDGSKVTVREAYRCGQLDDAVREDGRPLEERLAALEWLDLHGHGDLARRVITVTLGAGAEAVADELLALISAHRAANSFRVDHRRTVPWNTLSGFAREQTQHHEDPPLDVLGVTVQRSAKITRPKERGDF